MKFSRLSVRSLLTAAVLVAASTTVLASYTARLYFRNETTGEEGPGAIGVIPGQQVSLNWTFHRLSTSDYDTWTILEMLIDLAPSSATAILSDNDANSWDAAAVAYFRPTSTFVVVLPWQPSDGPMYDWSADPGDSSHDLVTTKAVHLLLGCAGNTVQAHEIEALGFFSFIVGESAAPGTGLEWALKGKDSPNGLSTRLIDANQRTLDPTDNYLLVADGPVSRVSGRVTLSDSSGLGPPPPSVSGVLTRNGQDGHTIKLKIGADGSYKMPLVADGYTLSVQRTHWLRRTIHIAADPGDAPGMDITLPNGDANTDGKVDLLDLSTVLRSFGADKPIGYADLNEDGAVTLNDLMIVFSDFNMVSDSP